MSIVGPTSNGYFTTAVTANESGMQQTPQKDFSTMSAERVDTNTGESTQRSARFSQWAAFLIFSTITMGAAVEERNESGATDDVGVQDQRWAIACSAITFSLTFIIVAMQLHPIGSVLLVGTKVEGALIVILLAFWAATVSIVSDARNGLAVSPNDGAVTNGNLYYFSWAGFVCAVMLTVSYLRDVFGVDVAGEIRSRSARLTSWSALLACQLVVMGASANIFDQRCAPRTESEVFCTRTKFGISIGAIGTFFALAITAMKINGASIPFMAEAASSVAMTTLNAFGVAYLTSAKGPGSSLGNLYYFSWLSLVAAAMLIASCFETYKNGGDGVQSTAGVQMNSNTTGNDIPVESLEDNNI